MFNQKGIKNMLDNHEEKKEFIAELRKLNPKVNIDTNLLLNIIVYSIALEELVLPEGTKLNGNHIYYKNSTLVISSDITKK
ncbi:MAG: hypothetical protein N2749_04685 [Clostridia bacterium]|nr:hypothetical protein [Clostridia bacterium]